MLALQGAFDVHAKRLAELGAGTCLVRKPEQLEGLDGLVLPGGESTTFLKHLERAGFYDALNGFVHAKPVFGTCAGCILLAEEVSNTLAARDGSPTLIRQGRLLAATFHPELTDDLRVHELFLEIVRGA